MTSIPDELLAINVRLKAMLLGLTNQNAIIVDYKGMIIKFRIAASMTHYKDTSKIILLETKNNRDKYLCMWVDIMASLLSGNKLAPPYCLICFS